MNAPPIRVREVRLYERPVRLRMPFRFGVVTLRQAPQAFVHVRIEDGQGRSAWGASAELLAPKWFDKSLALTNEQNFDQLRRALRLAGYALEADRRRKYHNSGTLPWQFNEPYPMAACTSAVDY
ncbi:MAG TPA: hypothetical protein VIV09_10160, partial [Pseudolabrys sp.]